VYVLYEGGEQEEKNGGGGGDRNAGVTLWLALGALPDSYP